MTPERAVEQLARQDAPRILAVLARQFRDIEAAQEAVQAALMRALERWQHRGVPEDPSAWLYTVARNVVLDGLRASAPAAAPPPAEAPTQQDEVALLFACCHPALEPRVQVGLALRALCGRTTDQVARAFLERPEATAQRLSRGSAKLREAGVAFAVPGPRHRAERLAAVLATIYLLFNEGYAPTSDERPVNPALCGQALALGHRVAELLPEEAEVHGLVALMQLHHARRDGRVDAQGRLVPLDQQDRRRWHSSEIAAGQATLDVAMALGAPGPYQLQAAIAALHARAARAADTDWTSITALYGGLLQRIPSPIVELNAAVALAMARGPAAGLAWIERLVERDQLSDYPLLHAARGDLLQRLDRTDEAARAFEQALSLTRNASERAHLQQRLAGTSTVRRRRRAPTGRTVRPLSDRAWSRVRALFPRRRGRGRPGRPDRTMLDAILWVLGTGAPWRQLPEAFGPWQTAYGRFRAWENDGRLVQVVARLRHTGVTPLQAHLSRRAAPGEIPR
ncbi:MAG: transposase [Myxococcales bacterium]|nr:transposase [Myxococcales bacterium]